MTAIAAGCRAQAIHGESKMQTRAMGPAAGWSWLRQAINLGRNNPKALFGAAALLMLVALIPSVIQLCAQYLLGASSINAVLWVTGVTTLAMLAVYPLLIGGFFRVIDDTEHNRPTRATALFDTFKAGQGRGRLVAFGVLLTLLYIVVLVAIFGTLGSDFAGWYWQVFQATQSATPAAPPSLPPMPAGFGMVAGLTLLVMMFLGGVYSIGFGQVALAQRSVGGAFADGFTGALKNLLPLLLLTVIAIVLMVVIALVLGLVIGLLAVLGGLVHPVLSVVLALPVYIAFLVVMYVVMFGVMYFMWRDVVAQDAGGSDHQVEL
jgi:hypothetical protein